MNIKTPLALALLLTASAAPAQFLPSPFSMTGGGSAVDDIVFKCSLVIPYRACTTAELNQREQIRASGTCPQPASPACVDYLMSQREAAPVQLLGNQSNPSTANDEFFKKCGTVPYRLCTEAEEKQKAAYEAEQKKEPKGADPEVNDAIQGPPQVVDMPKGGPEGKMLQYPSGRVEYCFDDSCTKTSGTPMTPKEAAKYLKEQYADQKQLANSINGGGPSLTNAGNPDTGGFRMNDNGNGGSSPGDSQKTTSTPPDTSGSPSGNSTPPAPDNPPADDGGRNETASGDNTPRGIGEGIGGDQGRLSGDTGTSSSGSGGGVASIGGGQGVIKVAGATAMAEVDKTGYSYTKISAAAKSSEALIKGGAATFKADSDNGRREVDSTIGDGSNLGKIQAVAQ